MVPWLQHGPAAAIGVGSSDWCQLDDNSRFVWLLGCHTVCLESRKGSGASSGLGVVVEWLTSSCKGAEAWVIVVVVNREVGTTANPEELDITFFNEDAAATVGHDKVNVGGRWLTTDRGIVQLGSG
jgi:hypothetical protein